jgi:hypothetical protein
MSDTEGGGESPSGATSQEAWLGREPSRVVGGLRGLGKVALAVAVLVAAAAAVAAVVALMF